MEAVRRLRGKIETQELTMGLLVTDHLWIDLIEIAARSEIDYLIVDMEHGAASTDLVADVCAAGRRAGFPIFVRPRSNDYAAIRLAIDLGPCGFLLACVETPAELDVVRDGIYLPPRGRRRPGGMGNRWVADYSAEAWRREVEDNFIVLPQIETRKGLANAAAIASHDLTTALAVGPYDLSAELGVCGQMRSPELLQALASIRAAADGANKPAWMIGCNAADLVRDRWRFICIGEPTSILLAALREKVQDARGAIGR